MTIVLGKSATYSVFQTGYVNYTPGEDDIEIMFEDKVVETWGITVPGRNGNSQDLMMGWKISGARRGIDNQQRLHGYQGTPEPMCHANKLYLEAMFGNW